MIKQTTISCEIVRQKAQPVMTEVCLNGGAVSCDGVTLSVSENSTGGCRVGSIRLAIQSGELEPCCNLETEAPVRLHLPVTEQPKNITALYMFSPWWTRPAFTQRLSELPDKTQTALFCFGDLADSFREHLLQNAYNALYHNALYVCDWDMFWTQHPDSAKHALLRAVSGGPVYCSDRVGETDAQVLKPLAYPDGELLMMSRSAMPTQDCVFTDPFKSGFLKLQNIAPYGEGLIGGGIAVFDLTDQPLACTFTPAEVEGITACERYLFYDFFAQTARFVGQNELVHCNIAPNGCRWYVLLPVTGPCTCLGMAEKYVGFTAVESVHNSASAQTVVLHASGTLAWASETAPKRITVDGEDVTAAAERKGILTVVPLTEKSGQTVAVLEC